MSKDENKKKKDVKNKNNSKFLKESKAELKKVSWPKPKALANDTATVIGIVLVVAIIVVILDVIFLALDEKLIVKTEGKIVNSTSVETTTDNAEDSNNSVNDEVEDNANNENDVTTEQNNAEENNEATQSDNTEVTENNEAE